VDKEMLELQWPEIKRLMEEQGADAVLAYTAGFDPQDQMDLDALAARKFYFQDWQGKSLDRYADFSNRVIHKYLPLAADTASGQEQADKYAQYVNALSYNFGANLAECWPDEAIKKEPHHFRMGLEAAERCLDLRVRLKKDHIALSRACWLAGAHHLALHQWEAAVARFTAAARHAAGAPESTEPVTCTPESNPDQVLNVGYLGVARWAAGQADGEALYQLAVDTFQQIAAAHEQKKADALFFVDQLKHVRGLYA
jgi:hypothetical protein